MIELLAKGIIDGAEVEVQCSSIQGVWFLTFNNEKNPDMERKLRELMDSDWSVGNYFPKTMKLKLCDILGSGVFFDRCYPREVEVFGEMETVPYYGDDVVY